MAWNDLTGGPTVTLERLSRGHYRTFYEGRGMWTIHHTHQGWEVVNSKGEKWDGYPFRTRRDAVGRVNSLLGAAVAQLDRL